MFAALSPAEDLHIFRVCADPDRLPFSDRAEAGFENQLSSLIAKEMGARLEYTWWSERKSFLRDSLNAGRCDAVMGVPATLDTVGVSKPYYRSSYVVVTRRDRNLAIRSLFDPVLDQCRIGIHITGGDYAPPAQLLARRGLASNIVAFSLFGPEGEKNPQAKLIDAVKQGSIDVAIIWGPFAGYFADGTSLDITPVAPSSFLGLPFTYEISVGVRKDDISLRDQIDRILDRKRAEIQSLLNRYHIPLAGKEGT